jgi:hypothetical protein
MKAVGNRKLLEHKDYYQKKKKKEYYIQFSLVASNEFTITLSLLGIRYSAIFPEFISFCIASMSPYICSSI